MKTGVRCSTLWRHSPLDHAIARHHKGTGLAPDPTDGWPTVSRRAIASLARNPTGAWPLGQTIVRPLEGTNRKPDLAEAWPTRSHSSVTSQRHESKARPRGSMAH